MTDEAEAELLKALRSDDDGIFEKASSDISNNITNPNNVMPVLCEILLQSPNVSRRLRAVLVIKNSTFYVKVFGVHSQSPFVAELRGQIPVPRWEEYRKHVATLAVPSLIKALSDPSFTVCGCAVLALREFGPDAAPAYSTLVRIRDRRDEKRDEENEQYMKTAKWYERLGNWLVQACIRFDPIKEHQKTVDDALAAIVGRDFE